MNIIIFDVETTGLLLPAGAPLDKQPFIIEFAAIKLDAELNEIGRIDFLINPGFPISKEIQKITGLVDADLHDKPNFGPNIPSLQEFFLGATHLVAHNVTFDTGMLRNDLERCDMVCQLPWPPVHICTVEASFHIKNRRMNLAALYKHITGEDATNRHRAIGDVETLVTCFKWLVAEGAIGL
jgi:DNA polymerase III epsilon subunit-like protein